MSSSDGAPAALRWEPPPVPRFGEEPRVGKSEAGDSASDAGGHVVDVDHDVVDDDVRGGEEQVHLAPAKRRKTA